MFLFANILYSFKSRIGWSPVESWVKPVIFLTSYKDKVISVAFSRHFNAGYIILVINSSKTKNQHLGHRSVCWNFKTCFYKYNFNIQVPILTMVLSTQDNFHVEGTKRLYFSEQRKQIFGDRNKEITKGIKTTVGT